MAFRTAWRNLWRNGRRTLITATAVALGTAILIVMRGLMDGLVADSVLNVTNVSIGEVQVHAHGYLADRSIYKSVAEPVAVLDALDTRAIPASARSYGYGLVAAGTKSAGARFWGVEPGRERDVFDIGRHVAEGRGRFLASGADGGVVLGGKLARSLNADVGTELVAVVQAADGSLGNELFTVVGILKSVGEAIDRSAALLHREDFERLFVSGGRVHEIAVNTRGGMDLDAVEAAVAAIAPGNEVRSWRSLLPMLTDMLSMVDVALWIVGAIFFLAAGLGVMNTMLMATYDRMREFGVTKALGASPWRIARDVAIEAGTLAVLATMAGAAAGLAACLLFARYGIDMSAFGGSISFAGVAFDPVWRTRFDLSYAPGPMAAMWAVCIVAALYPAALAARLEPVDAMRRR